MLCIVRSALAGLLALSSVSALATVTVERTQYDKTLREITVPAGQYLRVPLGDFRPGDLVAVTIDASNAVYKDVTACLAQGDVAFAYRPGSSCNGRVKGIAPFLIKDQPTATGTVYLILDNSFAGFIAKKLKFVSVTKTELSDEKAQQLQRALEGIHNRISTTFRDSDFDLTLKSCGEQNAYSETKTANITICSELLTRLLAQQNTGALLGIILHEYGHSLLNRWGEPGASEEDMADQFAAAMLLRDGDEGRRLLMQWVAYWQARDSVAEANAALRRGDTHSLSIQRARNLQEILNQPDGFMRRWNKMLYRHATPAELERAIQKPNRTDDVDLAQQARAKEF